MNRTITMNASSLPLFPTFLWRFGQQSLPRYRYMHSNYNLIDGSYQNNFYKQIYNWDWFRVLLDEFIQITINVFVTMIGRRKHTANQQMTHMSHVQMTRAVSMATNQQIILKPTTHAVSMATRDMWDMCVFWAVCQGNSAFIILHRLLLWITPHYTH